MGQLKALVFVDLRKGFYSLLVRITDDWLLEGSTEAPFPAMLNSRSPWALSFVLGEKKGLTIRICMPDLPTLMLQFTKPPSGAFERIFSCLGGGSR